MPGGNTKEKKKARELQESTGWAYTECLRCVRTLSEDEVYRLIIERGKGDAGPQPAVTPRG